MIIIHDHLQKLVSVASQKKCCEDVKTKQELVSLKSDCQLYASLHVVCQVRDGDLDEFFSHENHSISEHGRLRKRNEKSAFLKCLEE